MGTILVMALESELFGSFVIAHLQNHNITHEITHLTHVYEDLVRILDMFLS